MCAVQLERPKISASVIVNLLKIVNTIYFYFRYNPYDSYSNSYGYNDAPHTDSRPGHMSRHALMGPSRPPVVCLYTCQYKI